MVTVLLDNRRHTTLVMCGKVGSFFEKLLLALSFLLSFKGGISSGLLVVILAIVVAVLVIVGGLFYYAYTHPSSRSGIWLVEVTVNEFDHLF